MGFLDDAIREHLDLKRRRGADPAEIERAEREALGPARRPPEPLDSAEFAEPSAAAETLRQPPEPLGEDESAGYEDEQTTAWAEPEAPPQSPQPVPGESLAREPREHESARDPETAEYDVDAEPPHAAEGEDVLEETPEFLQDAPEHDRLWFEQRPPRDFDLDR